MWDTMNSLIDSAFGETVQYAPRGVTAFADVRVTWLKSEDTGEEEHKAGVSSVRSARVLWHAPDVRPAEWGTIKRGDERWTVAAVTPTVDGATELRLVSSDAQSAGKPSRLR